MATESRGAVVFTGHGSPLNAVKDNPAREGWKRIGKQIGVPSCILAVSSHWQTEGYTGVRTAANNRQLFDIYGFPQDLYEVSYEPAGEPKKAREILGILGEQAREDNSWGMDHGIWSILSNMYPAADVPVIEISVNTAAPNRQLYEIGQKIGTLREQGAMILASGNIVHNLKFADWKNPGGEAWADLFDKSIADAVQNRETETVVQPARLPYAQKAIPTGEHYAPLVIALGAADDRDSVTVFNDYRMNGSVSMTSFLWQTQK
jgi:4,5-DOPA dioxygenase extradiol